MSIQLEFPVSDRRPTDVIRDLSDYGKARAPQMERPRASDQSLRNIAAARLRATALPGSEERAKLTSEQIVDRRTSLADAQIALSAARGVSLDDIDPFSGYSTSRRAYGAVRHSWISLIKFHGFNDGYDQQPLDEALAWWAERRPQYLDGDDWLAAGMAAHREYWQGVGRGCGAPYCDGHPG
ncbi:hypothetical protein [Streptomyces sp. NBC_00878]|uniref:hypothetical protein n=1 Tax=Streptomyces sp. NBC_00878 TaxID=2975854 RepID=UPI00225831A8|nr:hypothetical protein [Streptomyces sp. NBC_00878]MCX4911835.1 hypothetical protein [Streptomyces sp. NBC_00878]